MRSFHVKRGASYCPGVNIDRLWSMMPLEVYQKAKETAGSADVAPLIDVTKLGYFKVLGKGVLPDIPLVVKARYFTKEVRQ
jgi:large subunit ribosomal protein L27Ae